MLGLETHASADSDRSSRPGVSPWPAGSARRRPLADGAPHGRASADQRQRPLTLAYDIIGLRQWTGFETRWLHLVAHHPVALDSAGFVAASRYRGFPWGVDEYLDLAANAPWLWWASMDWCVEPEIAHDEDAILDPISGTVRFDIQCPNGADRGGIADRFVPVIQGWHPEHYLRCLERMPFALDFPLVGIGSMCRRHVEGEYGILHVLDVLDRAFNGSETRFHLFGLKSKECPAARTHPRVASCDSQAYGVTARQEARKRQCGKPDTLVAAVMEDWFARQTSLMATKATVRRPTSWPSRSKRIPPPEIDAEGRCRHGASSRPSTKPPEKSTGGTYLPCTPSK